MYFGDGVNSDFEINDIGYKEDSGDVVMGGKAYDGVLGISNKGYLALYSGELSRILWK